MRTVRLSRRRDPVKHSDLLSSGAGLASAVAVETHGELGEAVAVVKARGYWEQVWLRFKRDRVAIAGGVFVIALLLLAFVGAPLAENRLGHGPNDINSYGGLDPESQLPVGRRPRGIRPVSGPEQEETFNLSGVLVLVGLIMLAFGAAVDPNTQLI